MQKLWTPFFVLFAIAFFSIVTVVAAIPFCTGGIIVQEIFKTPEQHQNPLERIPPQYQRVLEENGIKNCQVRPLQSYTSNQVEVKANGKVFIVFCDPNKRYLSDCCYNE
jgi:hypothetical protein